MAKLPLISDRDAKMLKMLILERFSVQGRQNFLNMLRYLDVNEETLRGWFDRKVDWPKLNHTICTLAMSHPPRYAGLDASFIPKAGKKTYGLDQFWDGSQSRAHKGLEISCLALFDPDSGQAYALDVRQTAADLTGLKSAQADTPTDYTRLDAYLEAVELLPTSVTHLAADSYYARLKTFQKLQTIGVHLVTKLRKDAHLRYLATEAEVQKHREKQPKGRKLRYAGKIDWQNLDENRWQTLQAPENLTN